MGNTISTDLLGKFLSTVTLSTLQSALAPVARFATVLPMVVGPSAPREIPIVTSVSGTQTDPAAFDVGDSIYDDVLGTPHLLSQQFGISNAEVQSGLSLTNLFTANAEKLGAAIMNVCLGPVTESNFGAAVVTVDPALYTTGDFDTLLASLSSANRAVILDTGYYTRTKTSWLPVGFSSVFENSAWSGAGTNVRGFCCDPRAVVVGAGLPVLPPQIPGLARLLQREVITVQPLGLDIEAVTWLRRSDRDVRAALNVYLAAAAADTTALKILKSAA
jgi:hypothetical protein